MDKLTDAGIPARPDCPFCATDLQNAAFYADERFLALYNIAPVLPGHSLVLPRAHLGSLLELSDADLAAFVLFARRITRLLARAFTADGFDWTIQDGRSAGQTVPHLHLHIIPRHLGDLPEPGDWYPALMASESAQIDSDVRPRLTPAEHTHVTAHLRKWAERGD
jgi:bis(5'-adenosyl)-triphosphatase